MRGANVFLGKETGLTFSFLLLQSIITIKVNFLLFFRLLLLACDGLNETSGKELRGMRKQFLRADAGYVKKILRKNHPKNY